jgi:hypothetical protein
MLRTIYGDPDRYVKQYWSKYPGLYFTGDSARRDKDGYFWIIGRVDDVIKVSGYRLGTAEIESALVSHPAVAEAAAIGLPHEVKGTAICGIGRRIAPARGPRNGTDCAARGRSVSGQAAQDPQRQDHAARVEGPGARFARRGYFNTGRIGW